MMKRFGKVGIMAFVLVLLLSVFARADQYVAPRIITVTGDAEVKVVPDEVILTLGVETSNNDLNVAKTQNDERVKKVLALAQKYNIDPKYVQTDYISIEPRYEDYYNRRNFLGYFVQKTVVFTLKDIPKFESLLSDALNAGANYVLGIQFRTTELRKYRDQARALAIKAAKEKAEKLAAELGQKVGKPTSIYEQYSGWYPWYNSYGSFGGAWSRGAGGMAQNVMMESTSAFMPTAESTIAPGQITVNSMVTVSFELEE